MNVIWLIMDSVSQSATPFAEDGENTLPEIHDLGRKRGIIYKNAYTPGPASPSAHASMFTGLLPSVAGMHEAKPFYTADYRTVGEYIPQSYNSMLISANPFIFNGLDKGFDETVDLGSTSHKLFDNGISPGEFVRNTNFNHGSKSELYKDYLKTLVTSSSRIKSVFNTIHYKAKMNRKNNSAIPEHSKRDSQGYQFANTMHSQILDFIGSSDKDNFVIANYMDAHAPLDASPDSIKYFSDKSHEELPVGVRGQKIRQMIQDGDDEIGEDMYSLYLAAIRDMDAKIARFISQLSSDTMIILTADHGNWFRRSSELEEDRIHVPLLIFHPELNKGNIIKNTVNIQNILRTTIEELEEEYTDVPGYNLMDVAENMTSITELIHDPNKPGRPVDPTGTKSSKLAYELALVKGNSRVDFNGADISISRDGPDVNELKEETERLKESFELDTEETIDYDEETKERLQDLGYL